MTEIKVQVVPKGTTSGDLSVRSVTENMIKRVDDLGDSVMEIAKRLQTRLSDQVTAAKEDWDLSEVSLTFSMDLEAEAGVIISRASTTATFEVSLTWSQQK